MESEIETVERQERAWKVLPDQLFDDVARRFPKLTRGEVEDIVRTIVARCFDLHVTHMAEFAAGE